LLFYLKDNLKKKKRAGDMTEGQEGGTCVHTTVSTTTTTTQIPKKHHLWEWRTIH
jgi:hypothetical protein